MDFASPELLRQGVLQMVRIAPGQRPRRVSWPISNPKDFDPTTDFFKIGEAPWAARPGAGFPVFAPEPYPCPAGQISRRRVRHAKTLAIATEGFDAFVRMNDLKWLAEEKTSRTKRFCGPSEGALSEMAAQSAQSLCPGVSTR
jgi:hypothetical protein